VWAPFVAIALTGWIAGVAVADPVGTGTFRVEGNSTTGAFCTLETWTNPPLSVFGTPVDMASSVGQTFCTGTVVGPISGHCDSTPDNTQLGYDFVLTSQAPAVPSGFSFITSVDNPVGALPTAIGAATFTFDGTATGSLPISVSTIPGCAITPTGYFTGTMSLNAFRSASTPSGPGVMVSASPTYTNPNTGLPETLPIDITFADVTAGGNTTVTATSSVAGQISSAFSLNLGGYRPSFFDVSTDATITPPITICQHYADSAPDDGIVDGTTISEDLLTLLHGEGMPLVFEDRTVSRDPDHNVICAEVNGLSPFIVAAEVPTNHDSVVLPPAAVKVKIGESAVTVTKKLKVKVQNADLTETAGHLIQLTVTSSTCPVSLLLDPMSQPVLPDFNPKDILVGNSITVVGGKTKTATLPLRFVAADYTSLNAKSPVRCSITLTATSLDTGPVAEVNPSNNSIPVTIDVIDKSDF
jgi:hypothetical protein